MHILHTFTNLPTQRAQGPALTSSSLTFQCTWPDRLPPEQIWPGSIRMVGLSPQPSTPRIHSSRKTEIWKRIMHYCDVIMGAVASQITSLMIVYSTVYSDADQSKHQSPASLAFVRGIHRGPVNSPHKWPVTRQRFPIDDIIMDHAETVISLHKFWWIWGFWLFFMWRQMFSRYVLSWRVARSILRMLSLMVISLWASDVIWRQGVGKHWFRQWLGVCSALSQCQTQCCVGRIVN